MCLAIPGQIVEFEDEEQRLATVEVSGVKRTVNVDLLSEEGLSPDDWVLIHVGFAMSKISEEEAQEQLDLLKMMGEADDALEEMRHDGTAGDSPDPLGDILPGERGTEEQTAPRAPPGDAPVDNASSEHEPPEES